VCVCVCVIVCLLDLLMTQFMTVSVCSVVCYDRVCNNRFVARVNVSNKKSRFQGIHFLKAWASYYSLLFLVLWFRYL
jgi:hypothetical protein